MTEPGQATELGPWVPPEEAHKLDAQTRARLNELIKELAAEARLDRGEDDQVDVVAAMTLDWLRAARAQADSGM